MLLTVKYLAIVTCVALALTGCSETNNSHNGEINTQASFPEGFNFKNRGLHVITSSINKKENTTSVLYGIAVAQKFAETAIPTDSTGVVMTLVTWKQQDDDRWFGAKIPGKLLSAETITIKGTPAQTVKKFELFTGDSLKKETSVDPLKTATRIKFILGQKASILP